MQETLGPAAVHKRYPHGVGRNNAHDHTSGTPVTNFKHSTHLYTIAMHYNKGLDCDQHGIAWSTRDPSARSTGHAVGNDATVHRS